MTMRNISVGKKVSFITPKYRFTALVVGNSPQYQNLTVRHRNFEGVVKDYVVTYNQAERMGMQMVD